MNQIYEIKVLGRGGQGGKTAAEMLASAALMKGKFIQSFPEYGAERVGAPVNAYARISDKEIRIHSPVKNPDVTVVLDETLLKGSAVPSELKEGGILIVNTSSSAEKVRHMTGFKGNLMLVDATKISMELFGKNIPNTPMLGAVVKASNIISMDDLKACIKEKFGKKLGEKVLEANFQAVDRAYSEVKNG